MIIKDVVRINNLDFKNSLALNLFGKDYNTAVKENEEFIEKLWNNAISTLTSPMTPHRLTKAYPDPVFSELLNVAKIVNACEIINNISAFVHKELYVLDYIVSEMGDGYFKVIPLGCFNQIQHYKLFNFLKDFKFVNYKRNIDYDIMGCSF